MSRYKFKLDVVNPDKNIVTIRPTLGTYAKWTFWSCGPSVLLFGGLALAGVVSKRTTTDKLANEQDEAIDLAND